ncbi:metal-dependent hydrolase [Halogeometricum luteum]|uniref:Metal-dependent hydrolase n=1 Tax=Halogeometricum luteum TaxID=2950537 RepID=A0ABU2G3E5_9EURY|nr:metal-dependent hydrolase [Halogeometricum sp. S3BR5-2]MDS0295304.1 metal-dependent hydrolase [Halogeometricum sp. S3BR5-2]
MIPYAHAAIGYLLWTGITHLSDGRPPGHAEVWLLLLGTQFPDIVDKPLAWTFGVLPSGRSLGHSLFTVAVVFAVLYAVGTRLGRKNLALAFGAGHLSHSLADVYPFLFQARYEYLGYLVWPILSGPPDAGKSFAAYLQRLSLQSFLSVQALLAALIVAIWVADGMPGLRIPRPGDADSAHLDD